MATGGTIAGVGKSTVEARYTAARLPIEKLLAAAPQIHTIADVSGEQVAQVPSQAMTNATWLQLAQRANALLLQDNVTGVVITHGTDTMEETAYFLDLVLHSKKPVVLVGSMRPPTSLSADGDLNLYNAVALAVSEQARGKGVLVVMNETVHSARDVTKSHTSAVDAFVSRGSGPLGRVSYGAVRFFREIQRPSMGSPFDIRSLDKLPGVDIVYGYANASALPVNALVAGGVAGIVHAGTGNGNLFPDVQSALIEARQAGVVIVRSSRVGAGQVLRNAEVNDDQHDFVVAGDLSPQKARILLMLALTQTKDTRLIQQWFASL